VIVSEQLGDLARFDDRLAVNRLRVSAAVADRRSRSMGAATSPMPSPAIAFRFAPLPPQPDEARQRSKGEDCGERKICPLVWLQ
jgi:hypothetical protein